MTTPKTLIPSQQLTNANATYYTVPNGVRTVIKKLTLENPTATARTVTLYLVAFGAVAGDAYTLLKTVTVPAAPARALDITEAVDHVLEQGVSIQAVCSANSAVTIRASGVEVAG